MVSENSSLTVRSWLSVTLIAMDLTPDTAAQAKAEKYGIKRVPAVVVDGQLAGCCEGGVDEATLKALGIGNVL